jgi:spore coat polysaccharide biosynthesis protein SpsF
MEQPVTDKASVIAILQGRMSSSRLPGKVLKPILGRPMIGLQLDRLKRCMTTSKLVVATSIEPTDDPIAAFCSTEDVPCFRGSLNDVLGRFEGAAHTHEPVDHVVRLTADCPLSDPAVIDRLVQTHIAGGFDYTSNVGILRFPDGLDAEVMTRSALAAAAAEATDPFEREHVTPFLYRHPERFRIGHLDNYADQTHMRWTVDTLEDFRMVEAVFRELGTKAAFGHQDVVELLQRRPDIEALNAPAAAR